MGLLASTLINPKSQKRVVMSPITYKHMEVIEVALNCYRDTIMQGITSGEAEEHGVLHALPLVLEELEEVYTLINDNLNDRYVRQVVGANLSDSAIENFISS